MLPDVLSTAWSGSPRGTESSGGFGDEAAGDGVVGGGRDADEWFGGQLWAIHLRALDAFRRA